MKHLALPAPSKARDREHKAKAALDLLRANQSFTIHFSGKLPRTTAPWLVCCQWFHPGYTSPVTSGVMLANTKRQAIALHKERAIAQEPLLRVFRPKLLTAHMVGTRLT